MIHWMPWVPGIGKGKMEMYDRGGIWTAFKRAYPFSFKQYQTDAQKHFGEDFEIRVAQTKERFKVQYRRVRYSDNKRRLARWKGMKPGPNGQYTLYISRLQAKHLLDCKRQNVERIIRIEDGQQIMKIKIALSD